MYMKFVNTSSRKVAGIIVSSRMIFLYEKQRIDRFLAIEPG